MKRMLALILLMSLMTMSCDKSDDSSDSPSTDTTTQPAESDNTDTDRPTESTKPETTKPTTPKPTTPKPTTPTTPTTPKPTTPTTPVSNVPQQALTFKTNVSYLSGFDLSDEAKYDKAVAIVKKVVATEAFRNQVLNHTYNGAKTFVDNNGLTNEQIYQSILDAAEKLTPTKNNTMDVGVKLYYTNNSVVGYTSTNITYINVNTKFFDKYDPNEVAGNLFHEWLHKLGYGHDSSATSRRPYSVPYAIGYMIRDIGKNFL